MTAKKCWGQVSGEDENAASSAGIPFYLFATGTDAQAAIAAELRLRGYNARPVKTNNAEVSVYVDGAEIVYICDKED